MGLVSELRRRNVLRMAVLYAVAAWLVMQVAEVVVTLASLPDWTGRVILVLLAVGFPISLIFSWFYELTPEGVSLERDVTVGESVTHLTDRRLDFVVIAMLCAALLLFAYDKWWMNDESIVSIAVLPFENLSAVPEQDYFADGMTDVLTITLGQIDGLRVTSRTTVDHHVAADKSLPEIVRELNVDAIVEGSIQAVNDEVRITLQLVDGRTDRQLWSKSYHRELHDVLTLQGEIARAIAAEVKVTLTPQAEARLARKRTVSADALRLWVIGNYHLKAYSFDRALQAFQEASDRDPEFAAAYAGIAEAYAYKGSWADSERPSVVLPLARSAAEHAIRLDPDLAEAHFALGEIKKFEWSWEAAEKEFRTGVRLNPSDTTGLLLYVNFLGAMGRFDEAIDIGMQVIALDPISPSAYTELGQALVFTGRRDESFNFYMKALELDPDFYWAHWLLAEFHIKNGEYGKAVPHMDKLRLVLEYAPPSLGGLTGYLYAIAGQEEDAQAILSSLLDRRENEYVPAATLAYLYVGLKDYDRALFWLEAAYEGQNYQLTWLNQDYFWDSIRNDPRFQSVLARMKFPDAP